MLEGATHPRGAGMRRLECLDLKMVLTTEAMHSTPLLNLLTGMPRAMGLALALEEVVSKVQVVAPVGALSARPTPTIPLSAGI